MTRVGDKINNIHSRFDLTRLRILQYSVAETRCTSSVRTDTLPGEKAKVGVNFLGVTIHQGDII